KLKEDKEIPVRIGDLESPQPVFDERQFLHERDSAAAELVEERIRVRAVDVRVRGGPRVPGVVWTGQHVRRHGLEHDPDSIPAHSGPERAVVRPLEVELKTETLAIEVDRGLQVSHDEVRSDRDEVAGHGGAPPLIVLRASCVEPDMAEASFPDPRAANPQQSLPDRPSSSGTTRPA